MVLWFLKKVAGCRDMNIMPDIQVEDVRLPRILLKDPDFGGTRDGDYQRGTLIIRSGRVAGLKNGPFGKSPRMVLPKLTEAHCHLDKCHTLHRIGDVGGDLLAAISAQAQDKQNWTEEDLAQRAQRGLDECQSAGCQTVRTHIDWGDSAAPPLAWHILAELQPQTATLQLAALTSIDQMADPVFAATVATHVAGTTGGILGSFVLNQDTEILRAGLHNTFAEAYRLGLALDFHVDESLDDLNGVELIADTALEMRHQGPVLCGHAVSLMNKTDQDLARIADKLAQAGIVICTLPTTNLYLQGRVAGTPIQRGITRVQELMQLGVSVIVGSDNVADAFCPLGQHDPRAALHLACLAGHLDPPYARLLPMITIDAQRGLGLPPVTVDDATLDQLAISDAPSAAGLVAGHHDLMALSAFVQTDAHSNSRTPA